MCKCGKMAQNSQNWATINTIMLDKSKTHLDTKSGTPDIQNGGLNDADTDLTTNTPSQIEDVATILSSV